MTSATMPNYKADCDTLILIKNLYLFLIWSKFFLALAVDLKISGNSTTEHRG